MRAPGLFPMRVSAINVGSHSISSNTPWRMAPRDRMNAVVRSSGLEAFERLTEVTKLHLSLNSHQEER